MTELVLLLQVSDGVDSKKQSCHIHTEPPW
jgi:hypothetical protein